MADPRLDADVLIVGAGCAGLSLAVHMLEAGLGGLRTVLLEPRARHQHDRTWCFWNVHPHPFERSVTHSWARWRVAGAGRSVVRGPSSYAYQHLPSEAFYEDALRRIGEAPRMEIRRGVTVYSVVEEEGEILARTSEGELRVGLAFDSRPSAGSDGPLEKDASTLVQHFLGVVLEADQPIFDPTTALVMDFDVDQTPGIHFVYVLPFDHRTALVEDTFFGPSPFSESVYLEGIESFLAERYELGAWRELRREKGVIPMDPHVPPRREARRVCDIGVRAGLARASTGYAFLAIQRHSERLARAIAGRPRLEPIMPPPPYTSRTAFLDRVFLSYIRRHPDRAPELFVRLFDRVPPDALVRFLFDGGRAGDQLRVVSALPAWPLTAEAVRCWIGT